MIFNTFCWWLLSLPVDCVITWSLLSLLVDRFYCFSLMAIITSWSLLEEVFGDSNMPFLWQNSEGKVKKKYLRINIFELWMIYYILTAHDLLHPLFFHSQCVVLLKCHHSIFTNSEIHHFTKQMNLQEIFCRKVVSGLRLFMLFKDRDIRYMMLTGRKAISC